MNYPTICPKCNEVFNDKGKLREYISVVYFDYTCPFCNHEWARVFHYIGISKEKGLDQMWEIISLLNKALVGLKYKVESSPYLKEADKQ